MTWEETIEYIRTEPSFEKLVHDAYLGADLVGNVERFRKSIEFQETVAKMEEHGSKPKVVLDIGCGNGISTMAFALEGYEVIACEPDTSETIGAGAIANLVKHFNLSNVSIHTCFAEDLDIGDTVVDVVYARQSMHHANQLNDFVKNICLKLRKGGLLLTIRDHVIYDDQDKAVFLNHHPLQKYYGGENAFTPQQYRGAMKGAGLSVLEELKYFDSVINYFPVPESRVRLGKVIGGVYGVNRFWMSKILPSALKAKFERQGNEAVVPGRMYSYIARKN